MAKATTKVYLLAKELGVKSTVIIDKCQAEGLVGVKNHMSTISLGLEATIREWFSTGEHTTTVETAAPVDEKYLVDVDAQEAEQKRLNDNAEEANQAEAPPETEKNSGTAPQVSEEQSSPASEQKDEDLGKKTEDSGKNAEEPASEKQFPINEPAKKPVPKPQMVELPSIKDIKPAGRQLHTPAPAKLSGPKVIRVEQIEETRSHRKPKPRTSGETFARRPVPVQDVPLPVKSTDDRRGGKKGKKGNSDADLSKKSKLRGRDVEERRQKLAAARGGNTGFKSRRKIESRKSDQRQQQPAVRPDKATISEPITVKSLSAALGLKVNDIILHLMKMGIMATANQNITVDSAQMIALEFGIDLTVEEQKSLFDKIEEEFAARERNEVRRPAIVTMLGHVDHGKTSLLDKIRSASVASGEAGGITQHTSAYQAEINGRKVTFLDTPGHAAFTEMRARGANMTDIVVLVVAADDGVMPQTVEAIRHAQAAGVTIVVALNKIDIPGIDINKVYGQLAEYGLVPTEWGGNTDVIKTSAQTGEGIDSLVEHLDLVADINEYKADPNIPATGWVVEAKMTNTQGVVATLLLKEGSIKKGDVLLAGNGYGRVRTLRNSFGKVLKEASPSMPVEITGLSSVPSAGDKFFVLPDINVAQKAAEEKASIEREHTLSKRSLVTLDNLFSQIEAGKVQELKIIIRADVQGSVDVLEKHLSELSTDEIKVHILHSAVGGITEGDVILAEASDAIVIGFNVVPEGQVRQLADSKGVDIRLYNIIYRITEDLRDAMSGMLAPDEVEESLGKLIVRDTFRVQGVGTIAGCYVTEGLIRRNCKVRLIRNNIVIKDNANLESLKHFKDDVKEVRNGYECGVKIAGYDDVKVDDQIHAYHIVEVKRTL
ncbi:MAG: translation initiation factor IF-2 [Phycisphaerae bacterium]